MSNVIPSGQPHELTAEDLAINATCEERMFHMMQDGEWYDLNDMQVHGGGEEAKRRIRNIPNRYIGWDYEKRKQATGRTYEYRLIYTGRRRVRLSPVAKAVNSLMEKLEALETNEERDRWLAYITDRVAHLNEQSTAS